MQNFINFWRLGAKIFNFDVFWLILRHSATSRFCLLVCVVVFYISIKWTRRAMLSCSNFIMSEFIVLVYGVPCLSTLSEHFIELSVANKHIFSVISAVDVEGCAAWVSRTHSAQIVICFTRCQYVFHVNFLFFFNY